MLHMTFSWPTLNLPRMDLFMRIKLPMSVCRAVIFALVTLALIPMVSGAEIKIPGADGGAVAAPVAPAVAHTDGKKNVGPVNKEKMVAEDPYGKLLDKGSLDVGFIHAFVASISVIIVSELGDKTFFIAAIMAMRHPRVTVFLGAMSALGLMTVLAAVLGYATTVIPRWLTYYASSALFALFGLKMLREGWLMSPDEGQEEYEEVKEDLRRKDEEYSAEAQIDKAGKDGPMYGGRKSFIYSLFSRVYIQALTLTFLAEWGDRSQIATIILAAREDVFGVILGGTLGHGICTGLAVIGGRFIAQRISVRTVTLVGGVVFIIFALSAFFVSPEAEI